MKKILLITILFLGCNKDKVEPFSDWEIYEKCPFDMLGGSFKLYGKTEQDIKDFIQELSSDPGSSGCIYKYKRL